jgi:hypothetical protein
MSPTLNTIGKRIAGLDVGIEMDCVRGHHHPAAPRVHAHELQAVAVAADQVQADPRGEFVVAVVERHAPAIDLPHHAHDVLDVERHPQPRVAHVASGGIRHLPVLEMKAGAREDLEVADVIVMQMRDDHVLDPGGVDVERGEALARVAEDRAVRRAPVSSLKPVSITKIRSGDFATQRKKSSGIGPS